MEVATAITLLTINLIVLSVVIIALIIVAIVLVAKINKIASNIESATHRAASAAEWLSPYKLFSEIAKVVKSFKNL